MPPVASVAMPATVAVTAPAANIRRRDALPGDLVAPDFGRDRHIFMTLLVIESYRKKLRQLDEVKNTHSRSARAQGHLPRILLAKS
jgi:hypothetical protein